MRVLVTGHKGFIGGHLYSSLVEKGYNVDGFDVGDELKDVKYDIIFHFAARGLIRKSIEMPLQYFEDDLYLTLKLLEVARKNGSKFVFPSSGSTQEPTNPYSLSKKQSVEWVKLYSKLYGLNTYVLRFFNIYGPGSRKGAVYLFTKAALTTGKCIIFGDGSHVRDFFNVSDVIRGCDLLIKGEYEPGELEFGTGTGTSVNDLITMIEARTGKNIEREYRDYIVSEADSLVSSKPALKDHMPLDQGIKEVIEFISQEDR